MTTITTMVGGQGKTPILATVPILSIDEISAAMYLNHVSVRKMSSILGVDSSRVHAMFKYRDEFHNRLLRVACTHVLNNIGEYKM